MTVHVGENVVEVEQLFIASERATWNTGWVLLMIKNRSTEISGYSILGYIPKMTTL